MAQDYSLQRVLAIEERNGRYGRASTCALRGKGPARACPAPCVIAIYPIWTNKVLIINGL